MLVFRKVYTLENQAGGVLQKMMNSWLVVKPPMWKNMHKSNWIMKPQDVGVKIKLIFFQTTT